MTMEYGFSYLRDNKLARTWTLLGPCMLPVVVNTKGVNTPCSTFRTLWLCSRFFWQIRVACKQQLGI